VDKIEAGKRLKALGLRLPLDTVVTVVQRLGNGDSLYSLFTEEPPLLSKGAARKIRDMLADGTLNFVLDMEELPPFWTKSIEVVEELTVEHEAGFAYAPNTSGLGARRRPDRIRARFEILRPLLPLVHWNIGYLETSGVPLEVGLQLLVEHDLLEQQITDAKSSHLIIQRFVALHYIVAYYLHAKNPPYTFIDKAAMSYAKGLIDNNPFLRSAGEGLVRYQVWRGPEFFSAFNNAQHSTWNLAASMRLWKQEVEKSIATLKSEFSRLEQSWDAVMAAEKRIIEREPDEQVRAKLQDDYVARLKEYRALEEEIHVQLTGQTNKEDDNGKAQA